MVGNGGSLFDELEALITGSDSPTDPTPPDPHSTAIRAGQIKSDGSYEQYGQRHVRSQGETKPYSGNPWKNYTSVFPVKDDFKPLSWDDIKSTLDQRHARESLTSMGFEIVEDTGKTLFEELGGIIPE